VGVTAKQLAVMGATLANGGVNPVTRKRVVREEIVDEVLAVMLTAGFYDESGRWAAEAGVPAKTGVGGGIVAVVPGRLAIASFSPPVNAAGNSVRAQLAIQYIADQLDASLFEAH
jgi:glutaminase